jgi:outer membrane protein assembly factor BamB
MTTNDRDAMIRLAIAPPADVVAPADLGDAIYGQVLATPQRRGLVRLGRFGWVQAPSQQLVAFGLLALLGVGLIVAGLLRPPATPVLTNYHGGPDRTGVMPGPGPAGVPIPLWNVQRPGAVLFSSMPLPAGGRVYVGDTSGFLAALDSTTGATTWEEDVGGAIDGGQAVAGDLVVVGTKAGDVVAYSETGSLVWRQPLDAGAVLASLLVADGVIYVGTDGGQLVALSPLDGHVLWRTSVDGPVSRGPAFWDGVLYFGTGTGRMYAVGAGDGTERWTVELGPGQVGTPAVSGGRVYVGRGLNGAGPDHDLVALDVRDGSEVWSFPSETGRQVHVGAIAHGRVYAASEDGNLYALESATGELIWTASIGGRLATLASVVGDVVYVSSTAGTVHAVDAATGDVLWAVEVEGGEPTMAAVVGGRLYIGTNLGRVIAFGDPPS